MRYDGNRTHAEQLPEIRANNQRLAAERAPLLAAMEAKRAAERRRVSDLIDRGLKAIGATGEDRKLVFAKTGFGA